MNFQVRLDMAIDEWNSGNVSDEWLFQTLREDFVHHLGEAEAFTEMEQTVVKLIDQENEMTATEVVETLLALARRSRTSQVPSRLRILREDLTRQFSRFGAYAQGKLEELFRHYGL
jgi:hypothetical protein